MERLVEERAKKIDELRKLGINPYPHTAKVSHTAAEVLALHHDTKPEQKFATTVTVAGRVLGLRRMGKATFVHLQDQTGRIQAYFTQDDLKNAYDVLRLADLGDFLGISGTLFTTRTGELTVHVQKYAILAKAIRPLPEKYHGLQDQELKYRQRYLDLALNADVRDVFLKRARIISTIRKFLDEKGFVEVETPTLQPVYGGAAAKPFTTKHNALDTTFYLRISDELYLKRLIVGGFNAVYEICKDFRNEGIDRTHNPEFTMLEWYEGYQDYEHGMRLFEELWEICCIEVNGTTEIEYQGTKLSLKRPWKRARMADLIAEHAKIDALSMTSEELAAFCRAHRVETKGDSWGLLVQGIFEHFCEKHLVQPTFVIDHPIETTPLCKPHRNGDPRIVERFEPFICGMEIGNAYTELNDPLLQRKLLEDQAVQKDAGNEEANPMDEDFVRAIEHGMPPTSGVGIGIDRMVMLLTDQKAIKDIILFPTLRPE